MELTLPAPTLVKPLHNWLRPVSVAWASGPSTPLLDRAMPEILRRFRQLGHRAPETPEGELDIALTTARFGEPLNWREALLFTSRRRLKVDNAPLCITFVHATRAQFQAALERFETILKPEPPNPDDFDFPGLAPSGYHTLYEQGRRGGPIMALMRLLQAQAKSIRIVLIVGDDRPEAAYHFDLVGAYPRSDGADPEAFYTDIVLRIVTAVCTREVTQHEMIGAPIPRATWEGLSTPHTMVAAAHHLDQRRFFTDMVSVSAIVAVPAVDGVVASQYSEGCFATWDPTISALVATITGSARPVSKGAITEDDLAVLVGVRADGLGAQVRHVEGKANFKPSSEAVEMMDMDTPLPKITLGAEWGAHADARVPVVRSKLHGHRGIAEYNPRFVEYVPLDEPYYHYLVSCATEAQANGIRGAFARAACLRNPDDPRQVAFTVLPGHGCMIVEKWMPGAAPFQLMWEAMDAGHLRIDNRIPQGPMEYVAAESGKRVVRAEQ
jgi:hypothetical protein